MGMEQNIRMQNYKNILIYLPNWLGDIIMSYPAINAIKVCYPQSNITVVGKMSMTTIFEGNEIIDNIIDINKYKEINKNDFDIIILLPNSLISAFRAFRMGIKERVGFSTDYRKMLLTKHTTARYKGYEDTHTTDHYINMINATLNLNIEIPRPLLLPISEKLRSKAKAYLEEQNIAGKAIFAYGIGATNGLGKIWNEQYYGEVANRMRQKYNASTLFVATPSDAPTIANIKKYLDHEPIIPNTDLGTIAAILSYSSFFLGNDSGAMHLASAIGIPTIGLYFSTPYAKNYPRGKATEVLAKYTDCAPLGKLCSGRKCHYGKKTYECRYLIKPEDIFNLSDKMLHLN